MDENVASFMALTGCGSEQVAQFFLESNGNELEHAVNMFLEENGAQGDAEPAAGPSGAPAPIAPKVAITSVGGPDEEEQRWYAGGAASGQEVIAPGQGGNMVQSFMESLQPHARTGTQEDLEPTKGAFTGSARTMSGMVKKAPKESQKVIIKFYQNDIFTVNDGPPRQLFDPANGAFLNAIRRRECPEELSDGTNDVQVSLMQMGRDYEAPKNARPTFQGTANRLGSEASTSVVPAAQPAGAVETWSGPDTSLPVTSIQIRLPDGTRLVGKFNHSQPISSIRAFVAAARPDQQNVSFTLVAGFPAKPVEVETCTIEEAGLLNAVVTFKK